MKIAFFAAFLIISACSSNQPPAQFPKGFDCSRLTNDESRAQCQGVSVQSPIESVRGTDVTEYPRGFDCGKLTNDESKIRCFNQSGISRPIDGPTQKKDEPKPKTVLIPEADLSRQKLPNPLQPEAVLISTGTGFFVTEDGAILTNEHVVAGCKRLRARRPSGVEFDLNLVSTNERLDLALLKAPVKGPSAYFRRGLPPLGESIIVYGFPLAGTLSIAGNLTTGSVSGMVGLQNDGTKLQISAPIQSGNSGGAVLDESGNVVGVVQSKLNSVRAQQVTGDVPQNINFAIRGTVAQQFLTSNGIKTFERTSVNARKPSALAESAVGFTVLVGCFK
jgi:S1-C subfamily serine protease